MIGVDNDDEQKGPRPARIDEGHLSKKSHSQQFPSPAFLGGQKDSGSNSQVEKEETPTIHLSTKSQPQGSIEST